MVSATTPTYQAVTILSLLVAAGILIFMGLMYTRNKTKWTVLDAAQQALQGPVSQLKLGHPGATSSASISLQTTSNGAEQFALFAQANPARPNAPYFSITSPTGRADLPLPLK